MPAPVPPTHRALPRGVLLTVLALLAVPVVAILIVPIYAHDGPKIAGWPFFYWYQVVWVLLSGAFTTAAFQVVRRARARDER